MRNKQWHQIVKKKKKSQNEYLFADKVDMIVCGTGTGGTLTGLSRKLKENNPDCKVSLRDCIQ